MQDGGAESRATVHLFGDLRVSSGAGTVFVTAPALRRLLTRIAIVGGANVSVGQLVDAMWGDDPPDRAKESLQSQIHRLRRVIGPDVVESTPVGYRLDRARATTDLNELTALASGAADESDDGVFLARVDAAPDLLSSDALPGLSEEPWAIPVVARVAEERATVAERRVRVLLVAGRADEAIVAAEQLAAVQPLRESAAIVLIDALAHAGRAADALRVGAVFRAGHIEQTGLSPSAMLGEAERRALAAELRDQHPSTLPVPPTPCIGRAEELGVVERLLGEARIVTLWGPGGIGKTRLALAVSERAASSRAVVFVDLSAVSHGERVLQAIGAACAAGTDASVDAVVRHLDERDTLLVLDTAEHVVAAVARLVGTLVSRSRTLRVLITSRERLDVPGEATVEVPPLGTAGPELFVQRATAARRGVRLDAASAPVIAVICQRLDGMPLAIELAAAQVAWRSLPSIRDALVSPIEALDSFGGRDAPRRQLSATIEWSWDLLDSDERSLLGRVSAFAGTFRLDAACAVADSDDANAVAHRLAALVRKSMVAMIDAGEPEVGYRLLDTVRAFVRGRGASTGEDAAARAAAMRWAQARLEEILACTRAGRDETAAVLRRRHGTNLAGAFDAAIAHAMTDEVVACIPAIAEIGWRTVVGPLDRVADLPGWDVHPAAPYLWVLRAADLREAVRIHEAAAAVDAAGLPAHLRARVRSVAIQAAAMVGADPSDDLTRLREIAAADDDPRTAWAHAYGEHWTHPIGDPAGLVWAERAGAIARASGRPAMAAIADYLTMQLRTGPEHADEYRRLLVTFERFEMGFYAGLCRTALDYADLGSLSVASWLAKTRRALGSSNGFVRHLGEHRAHLLAHHGATHGAAMVFGGLDRLRADGLDVTAYGTGEDRARIVSANPGSPRRGGDLGAPELSALVIDEMARLAGD